MNVDLTIDLDGTDEPKIIRNNQYNFPYIGFNVQHDTSILYQPSVFIIKHMAQILSM